MKKASETNVKKTESVVMKCNKVTGLNVKAGCKGNS